MFSCKCQKLHIPFSRENKLKDVVFEGRVKQGRMANYFSTCDIFCSPAFFGESFGIVLLEAMASGKPVVAFANDGYKRVLTGKGSEFLIEPKDWKELAIEEGNFSSLGRDF